MKKMLGFVVFLAVFSAPALGQALSPNPYPTLPPQPSQSAPPFPPDGTYTYVILLRGEKRVGTTQVVVLRRPDRNLIDLYESGSYGKFTLRLHASLRYSDLLPSPWDVTYTGVLPMSGLRKTIAGAKGFTVRYLIDQDGGYDVVDGVPAGDAMPLWNMPLGMRHVRYQMVLDPPFLAGFFAMPQTLALRGETYVAPISEAFWSYKDQEFVHQIYPKEAVDDWPNDIGLVSDDFILYYDPKTGVVHEAFFVKSGLDAHLESTTKTTSAAASFGTP
jgi:hypothetical protein